MIDYKSIFCGKEAEAIAAIEQQINSVEISTETKSVIYLKATWFFNQNAQSNSDNKAWIQTLKKIRAMFSESDPAEIKAIAEALQMQIDAEKPHLCKDYLDCICNLLRVASVEYHNRQAA